jgi:hypothetical protein
MTVLLSTHPPAARLYNAKQKSFSIDEIGWIIFSGKPKIRNFRNVQIALCPSFCSISYPIKAQATSAQNTPHTAHHSYLNASIGFNLDAFTAG